MGSACDNEHVERYRAETDAGEKEIERERERERREEVERIACPPRTRVRRNCVWASGTTHSTCHRHATTAGDIQLICGHY